MDAEFSEINITPLTDVLLVLLVIFMILAAPAVPPGFERRLPCNCISDSHVKPPLHADVTENEQQIYPALATLAQKSPKAQSLTDVTLVTQ